MGERRRSGPVKIITGLIFNDLQVFDKASSLLLKKLGPVDLESEPLSFDHTSYYNDEMGAGLKRRFLSFRRLKNPKDLHRLKIFTDRLEKKFSASGRRAINIDPGYLSLSKLVLFSTKDYAHRIYLANGIYSEVTLFFKESSFQSWGWTYPDYKTKEYIDFFNHTRQILLNDLKRV